MTLDEAINDLTSRITQVSPTAVIRLSRSSAEEATIRAYAPAEMMTAIKNATQDRTIELLTDEGLDVQVLVYDVAIDLPPEA